MVFRLRKRNAVCSPICSDAFAVFAQIECDLSRAVPHTIPILKAATPSFDHAVALCYAARIVWIASNRLVMVSKTNLRKISDRPCNMCGSLFFLESDRDELMNVPHKQSTITNRVNHTKSYQ